MLLKHREELKQLLLSVTKTEEQLKKERLKELEEEHKLDDKESKLFLDDFTEEVVEEMSWQQKLNWIVQGLYSDLSDVSQQMQLNSLKGTTPGEELKANKKERERRAKMLAKKQKETVEYQEKTGILPPGTKENLERLKEEAGEYNLEPTSLEPTKFEKFSDDQLKKKKDYLIYRIDMREQEVGELREINEAKQKQRAEKAVERTRSEEYAV